MMWRLLSFKGVFQWWRSYVRSISAARQSCCKDLYSQQDLLNSWCNRDYLNTFSLLPQIGQHHVSAHLCLVILAHLDHTLSRCSAILTELAQKGDGLGGLRHPCQANAQSLLHLGLLDLPWISLSPTIKSLMGQSR